MSPERVCGAPGQPGPVSARTHQKRNRATRPPVGTDCQFHGIRRRLSPFFRGAIKQQTHQALSRFKALHESGVP